MCPNIRCDVFWCKIFGSKQGLIIIPKLHSVQTRSFAQAICQYSTDPNSHAEQLKHVIMTKQKHSGVTDAGKTTCTRLGRGNTTDEVTNIC